MFEQSLVEPALRRRRPAAVALSLALQAAGIAALAIVPLWRHVALPLTVAPAAVMAPRLLLAVPPAPRPGMRAAAMRLVMAAPPVLASPVEVPNKVLAAAPDVPAAPPLGLGTGTPGGAGEGLPGGALDTSAATPPGPVETGPMAAAREFTFETKGSQDRAGGSRNSEGRPPARQATPERGERSAAERQGSPGRAGGAQPRGRRSVHGCT